MLRLLVGRARRGNLALASRFHASRGIIASIGSCGSYLGRRTRFIHENVDSICGLKVAVAGCPSTADGDTILRCQCEIEHVAVTIILSDLNMIYILQGISCCAGDEEGFLGQNEGVAAP